MAARVKVIDIAKELGVTSKDLIVALEAMGQKAALEQALGDSNFVFRPFGSERRIWIS